MPILIIEDDSVLRTVLEASLAAAGFAVATAATAQAAIALLDRHASGYAAIIADIDLGDRTSGWDIARHARAIHPDIQVIYMSAGYAGLWPSQGVPDSLFLQKPFAIEQLVASLQRLREGLSTDPCGHVPV